MAFQKVACRRLPGVFVPSFPVSGMPSKYWQHDCVEVPLDASRSRRCEPVISTASVRSASEERRDVVAAADLGKCQVFQTMFHSGSTLLRAPEALIPRFPPIGEGNVSQHCTSARSMTVAGALVPAASISHTVRPLSIQEKV